ncbi:unnamed protein product [Effrenium voratum]|nr:unnamed protein product [Effrenium voratum]
MSRFRRLAAGTAAAAVVGGGGAYAMYRQRLKHNKAVSAEDFNSSQKERLAPALARVAKKQPQSLEMFRYTTCPYCGKVKAFLDYYRIPHETIEVEPMFKSQLAPSEYKKLPQLRFGGADGAWLVDSDGIVDTLAPLLGIERQLKDPEVQRWRGWARESLVRHVTLNINRTLLSAWEGYRYIDAFDTIPLANKIFLKVVGAPIMYMVAAKKTYPTLVKAGELKDGDDWRTVFHQQVNQFTEEAVGQKQFHGGKQPDLADLDVYGVLQSIRGHDVYQDMLQSTRIGPWMARMDRALGAE